MNDVDETRAACLLDPSSDTHRLVHADALEDRSGPGDIERAEFIRVQVELAGIGEPRVVLGDDSDWLNEDEAGSKYRVHLTERGGPDYFTADSANYSPVDSRVDVRCGFLRGKRWKTRVVHGLLVRRVETEGLGSAITHRYTLKRDVYSVPWQRGRHDELCDRERRLWCDLAYRYATELTPFLCNVGLRVEDAGQSPIHEWAFVRRGFVEHIRVSSTTQWMSCPEGQPHCRIGFEDRGAFGMQPCHDCKGDKRKSLGARLVKSNPLTRVDVVQPVFLAHELSHMKDDTISDSMLKWAKKYASD